MIDLSFDERIAILRLAHGPVNALDGPMFAALVDALDEVERSAAAAAVITGTGDAFSAGADLLRLMDEGTDYIEAARPHAGRAFERIFLIPVPLVAAINGHAIAGGCVLALACDHRVASSGDHRIGLAEQGRGPLPDVGPRDRPVRGRAATPAAAPVFRSPRQAGRGVVAGPRRRGRPGRRAHGYRHGRRSPPRCNPSPDIRADQDGPPRAVRCACARDGRVRRGGHGDLVFGGDARFRSPVHRPHDRRPLRRATCRRSAA